MQACYYACCRGPFCARHQRRATQAADDGRNGGRVSARLALHWRVVILPNSCLQKPDCHLLCCRPKTTLLCGELSGRACTAATFVCQAQLMCKMLAVCNVVPEQMAACLQMRSQTDWTPVQPISWFDACGTSSTSVRWADILEWSAMMHTAHHALLLLLR